MTEYKNSITDKSIPYKRIRYIEGTGTQWLNTLVPQIRNMAVEMHVSNVKNVTTDGGMLFGEDWHTNGCFCQLNGDNSGINMFLCKKCINIRSSFFNSIEQKRLYVSYDHFEIDDFEKVYQDIGNTVEDRLYPICFWHATKATWSNNFGKFRLHSAKVWTNGNLVFDAIPVTDDNGDGCMYDFVTENLFTNQGTGKFLIGE